MEEYDDESASGLDLDALQAQINMAMAETEELISSWVQPSKNLSQRNKKSIEEVERELKEYLRRPPRLGVGAPVPEPVGPNVQEEAKLKNKLVGNDKKRRREDDTTTNNPDDGMDEEEETRKGESSTKIARVDPFSLPKKKAKHKAPDNGFQGQTNGTVSSHSAANAVSASTTRELSEVVVQEITHGKHEASPTIDNAAASSYTIPITNGIRIPSSSSHGSSALPERLNPLTLPDKSRTTELNMSTPSHISPPHTSASTLNGTAPSASSSASNLGGSTQHQQQLPTPAPSQDAISPSTTTMSAKKKKKKKKKKRKVGLDYASTNPEVVKSVADSFNSPSGVSCSGKVDDAKFGLTIMTTTGGTNGTNDKQDRQDADSDEHDDADSIHDDKNTVSKYKTNGIAPSPKSRNETSHVSSPRSEPPRRTTISLPHLSLSHLLNLTAPPESVAGTDDDDNNKDETSSVQSPFSPSKKDKKKKRRRKKKKKKHNLTGSTTDAVNE